MAAEDPTARSEIELPPSRGTSVVVVAAAAIAWWPAFTLGAYGVIFFEQTLSLWAVSMAIFLVSLTVGRRDRISWPQRLALLLPTQRALLTLRGLHDQWHLRA
jgi:hypothetical protein